MGEVGERGIGSKYRNEKIHVVKREGGNENPNNCRGDDNNNAHAPSLSHRLNPYTRSEPPGGRSHNC